MLRMYSNDLERETLKARPPSFQAPVAEMLWKQSVDEINV